MPSDKSGTFGPERFGSYDRAALDDRFSKGDTPTPVFCAKSAEGVEGIGDSVLRDAKECVRV
jgi:hypothetical protein